MKKIIASVFVLFFITTLTAQKNEAFKWLVGTWKIDTKNGSIVEVWQLKNDSTLQAKSYFVKNNTDTLPEESVELICNNNNWFFIPTVNGQNNNKPVVFKLIFYKGTEFICENPEHDYPQRITYRRIKNQLFASTEGREKGKYKKQNFDFNLE